VIADVHRVELDPRVLKRQAEGAFVADEVNFVATKSELDPERCRKDPAAAYGGVANNSDSQRF